MIPSNFKTRGANIALETWKSCGANGFLPTNNYTYNIKYATDVNTNNISFRNNLAEANFLFFPDWDSNSCYCTEISWHQIALYSVQHARPLYHICSTLYIIYRDTYIQGQHNMNNQVFLTYTAFIT